MLLKGIFINSERKCKKILSQSPDLKFNHPKIFTVVVDIAFLLSSWQPSLNLLLVIQLVDLLAQYVQLLIKLILFTNCSLAELGNKALF